MAFEDLEPDALDELGSGYSFDGVDAESGDNDSGIRPDFDNEDLFDTEESFSSSGSSSSRSTPAQDWTPHWHSRFQHVLSSHSREECANACRVLVLSNNWEFGELAELAYQLVSSVVTGVSPLIVTACAVNIKHMLLEVSKHEAASYFVSCVSQSAFAAWHHYWNPVRLPSSSYSIPLKEADTGHELQHLPRKAFLGDPTIP